MTTGTRVNRVVTAAVTPRPRAMTTPTSNARIVPTKATPSPRRRLLASPEVERPTSPQCSSVRRQPGRVAIREATGTVSHSRTSTAVISQLSGPTIARTAAGGVRPPTALVSPENGTPVARHVPPASATVSVSAERTRAPPVHVAGESAGVTM